MALGKSSSAHFSSFYRWLVATQYLGLPRRFDENVLDIGSGRGHFLSRIQAPLKTGIDLSRPESRLAPLVQADACRLPIHNGTFGHVFAFDVLEHVEDDRALVHEALRVLKRRGVLWVSTPAAAFSLFPGELALKRMSRSWGHVRRGYSREQLMAVFPGADVEVAVVPWNEPFLRVCYFPLKILSAVLPSLMPAVVAWVVARDARRREGDAGHLFARITKGG